MLHLEDITLRLVIILSHPTTLNLPTPPNHRTVVNPLTLLILKPLTVLHLCPSLISHLPTKITIHSRLMAIKAAALVIQGSSIIMAGLVIISHHTTVVMGHHLKASMVHHMVDPMGAHLTGDHLMAAHTTSPMEDLTNLLMGNNLPTAVSLRISGNNALLIRDLQVDGKDVMGLIRANSECR